MQVSNHVNSKYYTSYESNTNVKGISGFSLNFDGVLEAKETEELPGFIGEIIDYEEFHKAWMSQGANTPFSYTENKGLNKEENSISLVPGMSVRLNNGFMISINDSMVQALGNFMDNAAAEESTAVAGALNHLIKVANGQIPMNMFYSRNQDNSAYAKIGLQAFGIDTSRPFTINEKTFHFDNEGQIRLGSGNLAYYMSESANEKSRILEGSAETWSPKTEVEKKADSEDKKLTTYYQGVPMEEWAITDEKYTDPETGISWYVRDGKFPYMIGEDAEKFNQLCEETGEFPVKKFAEMTGFIRQLDENTTAYIGDNGIAVEGKDGRELFVDTSHLTYDMLMNLFDNLSGTGDYFDSNYWNDQIRNILQEGAL